jgi:CAAX prenyl protease-like protein
MTTDRMGWVAYSAPMVVFGVFTAIEGWVPPSMYPLAYSIKIAAVIAAFFIWRGPLGDIRPSWKVLVPSLGVGLIIIGSWLVIDQVVPYPHIGARTGFDPGTIESDAGRLAFLLVRLSGLVIVVPVMEELFWRSFLLRYLSGGNAQALPIGAFSLSALTIMVVISASAHTEWLVAALASVIFAYWLRRTRSLFAAIVSHAAANGALGVYILQTHDWKYW